VGGSVMVPRVLTGNEIPDRRAFGGSPAEVTADGHVALPGGCCRRPVCDFGTLSRAPRVVTALLTAPARRAFAAVVTRLSVAWIVALSGLARPALGAV